MYTLTAADFADTGQWRLVLKISYTGLSALLENTLHPEVEPQELCNVSWPFNRDMLRQNIEDAVYNNPRLLDDFAARVILFDPRTLFIPTEIAEEGGLEDIYKKVYKAEDSDIMSDSKDGITAAWSMAPGLKGFLLRTFPGAVITSNLMNRVKEIRSDLVSNSGETREKNKDNYLYIYARLEEADLILLEGNQLLSASTHEWNHTDDIGFLTVNLLKIYGKELADTHISVNNLPLSTDGWNFIYSKAKSFTADENN